MPIDPVCGMTVEPATAAGSHDYHGTRYYFCNPSCLTRFKADPESFLKPRAQAAQGASSDALLHVSHASGGRPAGARRLPEVRDGSRADDGLGRRWSEPGARRHDAAPLDRRGDWRAGVRPRDGRHVGRVPRLALDRVPRRHHRRSPPHDGHQLDRSRLLDAGRAVGRPAVLRAWMGIDQDAPAQHVHAHRARHRRGLAVQRRRDARAADLPGGLSCAWRGRDVLRHGGRHHHPRAARPGARAAAPAGARARPSGSCSTSRRGRRGSSATARNSTSRSRTSGWAIACACGPGKRSRPTVSSSRDRASSTSRC